MNKASQWRMDIARCITPLYADLAEVMAMQLALNQDYFFGWDWLRQLFGFERHFKEKAPPLTSWEEK
jgi:hypothetical protein